MYVDIRDFLFVVEGKSKTEIQCSSAKILIVFGAVGLTSKKEK